MFTFPDRPKYAAILVGVNKIGAVLDIEVVQYGEVSKNFQHANRSRIESGYSFKELTKKAINKAMVNADDLSDEEMHYQGVVDELSMLFG